MTKVCDCAGPADLGRALAGAVESRTAQEEIDLLPGFSTGFFNMQETLDLRTGPRLEQVLMSKHDSLLQLEPQITYFHTLKALQHTETPSAQMIYARVNVHFESISLIFCFK